MPEGEAAIGAAAARAVLSSTVPSSDAPPRRPPRRILSGGDLAQPPRAPLAAAAAAAAARGGASGAGNAAASDAPLSPANAALLAELHRCVLRRIARSRPQQRRSLRLTTIPPLCFCAERLASLRAR